MSPESAIAALDRAVHVSGEQIRLRRTTGTQQIPLDVDCHACVRGYAPDELLGTIAQGDRKVILSPTEMKNAQWTWPPRVNDKCIIGGKQFTVFGTDNLSIGGQLVRIELQVRG